MYVVLYSMRVIFIMCICCVVFYNVYIMSVVFVYIYIWCVVFVMCMYAIFYSVWQGRTAVANLLEYKS